MASMNIRVKYHSVILLAVAACTAIWSALVNDNVPYPYLDEFFHVRQAQVYCSGDFRTWDPKITTPPGLYFLSYVIFLVTGACDLQSLRLLNAACLSFVGLVSFSLLQDLWRIYHNEPNSVEGKRLGAAKPITGWYLAHSAINICLFPPLFFFSGLYYTDIASTLLVLLSLRTQLASQEFNWQSVGLQLTFAYGALLFRQTNIFWVGIFPIGIMVLKKCLPTIKDLPGLSKTEGSLEDYFYLVSQLIPAAFRQAVPIILGILQYAIVLLGFLLFVVWNGGVVLGDKSNHVATLHLSQMLYIWPYALFFSWPLAIQSLASIWTSSGGSSLLLLRSLPRFWVLTLFIGIAVAIVHYNTIIHPFTLADNRHYVFYVFRLLRRHWAIKYLATPVYIVGGWLVALCTRPNDGSKISAEAEVWQRGFLLVCFAASALSLITAPLVEPRYFIVPWIVWRLQVAAPLGNSRVMGVATKEKTSSKGDKAETFALSDHGWLTMETLWYLAVNVATGFIFLNWTFEWPQDPGAVQRFMW